MRASLLAVLAAGVIVFAPARAQINIDAYRDYFLVGQFGEVCTMCEIVVLCEAGDVVPLHEAIPDSGSFTLYHLETRTFWSQISTIWEWFIVNFTADVLAQRGHGRPVNVYAVNSGQWSKPERIEGRLILEPGLLEFGRHNIDRVNRQWLLAETGMPVGYCSRLPLWDSLAIIDSNVESNTGGAVQ